MAANCLNLQEQSFQNNTNSNFPINNSNKTLLRNNNNNESEHETLNNVDSVLAIHQQRATHYDSNLDQNTMKIQKSKQALLNTTMNPLLSPTTKLAKKEVTTTPTLILNNRELINSGSECGSQKGMFFVSSLEDSPGHIKKSTSKKPLTEKREILTVYDAFSCDLSGDDGNESLSESERHHHDDSFEGIDQIDDLDMELKSRSDDESNRTENVLKANYQTVSENKKKGSQSREQDGLETKEREKVNIKSNSKISKKNNSRKTNLSILVPLDTSAKNDTESDNNKTTTSEKSISRNVTPEPTMMMATSPDGPGLGISNYSIKKVPSCILLDQTEKEHQQALEARLQADIKRNNSFSSHCNTPVRGILLSSPRSLDGKKRNVSWANLSSLTSSISAGDAEVQSTRSPKFENCNESSCNVNPTSINVNEIDGEMDGLKKINEGSDNHHKHFPLKMSGNHHRQQINDDFFKVIENTKKQLKKLQDKKPRYRRASLEANQRFYSFYGDDDNTSSTASTMATPSCLYKSELPALAEIRQSRSMLDVRDCDISDSNRDCIDSNTSKNDSNNSNNNNSSKGNSSIGNSSAVDVSINSLTVIPNIAIVKQQSAPDLTKRRRKRTFVVQEVV
eukprot:Awhi_evm1s5534